MKRILSLALALFIIQYSANSQQMGDNIKTALLIVDIQNFYFRETGLD